MRPLPLTCRSGQCVRASRALVPACGNSIRAADMSRVSAATCRRQASHDRDFVSTPSRSALGTPGGPEAAPAERDRSRTREAAPMGANDPLVPGTAVLEANRRDSPCVAHACDRGRRYRWSVPVRLLQPWRTGSCELLREGLPRGAGLPEVRARDPRSRETEHLEAACVSSRNLGLLSTQSEGQQPVLLHGHALEETGASSECGPALEAA